MVTRRHAREWALQMLVQFDLNPPDDMDAGIAAFWKLLEQLEEDAIEDGVVRIEPAFTSDDRREAKALAAMKRFAEERVRGVWEQREDLDARLEPYLKNWSLYRLGSVERNALRLGAWELVAHPELPAAVVVNEAIDITKYFTETKAGRFVNGVLDRFARDLRTPEAETFTPEEAKG